MVSYSRRRPARSRADPRRCVEAAAGGVAAPARVAGSVPVALMFSPYGLILGPCRHGQGVTAKRDHSRESSLSVSCLWLLVSVLVVALDVELVHGGGEAAL